MPTISHKTAEPVSSAKYIVRLTDPLGKPTFYRHSKGYAKAPHLHVGEERFNEQNEFTSSHAANLACKADIENALQAYGKAGIANIPPEVPFLLARKYWFERPMCLAAMSMALQPDAESQFSEDALKYAKRMTEFIGRDDFMSIDDARQYCLKGSPEQMEELFTSLRSGLINWQPYDGPDDTVRNELRFLHLMRPDRDTATSQVYRRVVTVPMDLIYQMGKWSRIPVNADNEPEPYVPASICQSPRTAFGANITFDDGTTMRITCANASGRLPSGSHIAVSLYDRRGGPLQVVGGNVLFNPIYDVQEHDLVAIAANGDVYVAIVIPETDKPVPDPDDFSAIQTARNAFVKYRERAWEKDGDTDWKHTMLRKYGLSYPWLV